MNTIQANINVPVNPAPEKNLKDLNQMVIDLNHEVEQIGKPDEEDITKIDGLLKFKDKSYDASNFSGFGRKYLRKNLVGGKNTLTYEMLSEANTIYNIQYDFDLDGKTITVPENCVLEFEGGSLSNGTLVGDDIIIHSNYKSLYCSINGTIINQINLFNSGSTDINTSILKSCINGVSLMEDITIKGCFLHSSINGNNHSITITGSRNFITVARKDIIIESTTFIKDSNITDPLDRYMFKIGNNDNFILENCKVYNGSITAGASWEQYEETGTCKNVKITNCYFDVDWTTLDALNPGQETQNDIFVFGGCDNVSIENCYIKFKNTNRVFKTFANKSSDGQYDTQNLDNLARTISIKNNTIIGESTTINGKQVYDMFSASTNVYICNNYIEVRGYNRIFDNKTSATDSNYNNIIVIENNIIKTENIIMCLRLKGYDTTVVFSKNECIASEVPTLTGLLIYPIYIKHAEKVVIEDNSFTYTAGNKYLFFLSSDDETVGNINSLTINRNVISSGYKTCVYVDNCTIKDMQFTYNCIKADDKHISFGSNFKINRLTFIDRNNFGTRTNYYISNKPNAIDYLYFDVPLVNNQKLIGSGASIPTIITPLKIQGTNNLTCAGYSGSSNPSSLIHIGETFYNTTENKNVIWNGTKWIEPDGATAGVARHGTSSERPAAADIYVGFMYIDTTLGYPIYWNGTKWVDEKGYTALPSTSTLDTLRTTHAASDANDVGMTVFLTDEKKPVYLAEYYKIGSIWYHKWVYMDGTVALDEGQS